MTIKDFLFAVINFVILFGALFLITRKMIVRMFKERKDKIAQDLEQSHQADLESQRLSTDVAQARDQARQQEDTLLAETRAQVERSSREAEKLRTEEADALRRNAIQTEKRLRSQMHGQVSAQVIRQVASQAGETLKTSTFAPERQALVERYIEQVKEVVAAMPSDILNMNELKKLNISIASPEPTRRTPISYAVFCLKKKKVFESVLHDHEGEKRLVPLCPSYNPPDGILPRSTSSAFI